MYSIYIHIIILMEETNTSINEDLIKVINDMKKEIIDMKKIINVLVQNKNEKEEITEKNDKNITYVVIKGNQATDDMNHKIDIVMQLLEKKQETKNDVLEVINEETEKKEIIKSTKKKTKVDKFQKERVNFVNELEKIMGLTETKREVLLYDLENNNELKKYLKDKIADIQKFYNYYSWNYFKKKDASDIGLLKSIFKNEKYNIMNKQVIKEINGIKKMYSVLYFIKT
jgi:hypothetical protein